MMLTAASPAPAFTPRMPGSASGLRVMPCRIAPDVESAMPTRKAVKMRGSRNTKTTRLKLRLSG